jgi:hypothetical protein
VSPALFNANASLLLAAFGSPDVQSITHEESGRVGGSGGTSAAAAARFVESSVCGDENTIGLLTQLLCGGHPSAPGAHDLETARGALCLALRRRPASVAAAATSGEVWARCSHAVVGLYSC